MAFLMNKAFLGASLGAQNGSKTVMMAKATKVVKKAAQQVASKVGGGSAKGFRRYQGACTLPDCAGCQERARTQQEVCCSLLVMRPPCLGSKVLRHLAGGLCSSKGGTCLLATGGGTCRGPLSELCCETCA